MPRDSNGSYSLPNGTLVNSGDTVLPSQHNPFASDAAQSITNSLSRDGLGGMRANLDMGGYQAKNLANGSSDTDAATVGQIAGLGVPVATLLDYAGDAAPTGFLMCFGQAVSRTDYAELFAAIGTTYGPGDASTTFNIPDARGRAVVGKDDMGGTSAGRLSNYAGTTLGAAFGSQEHQLTIPQIPAHSHGVTDPGHTHDYTKTDVTGGIGAGSGFGQYNAQTSGSFTGISINNAGGGEAHANVQPVIVFNKIIKAVI